MYIQGEEDWNFEPIGGATGEAYLAERNDEKIFVKRNVSPIVAPLSAAGITPKLIWSQRTFSGDTLTAQEWKDGHLLKRENMSDQEVIDLIKYIHTSDDLLHSLQLVGGKVYRPNDFINDYLDNLSPSLASNDFFNEVIEHLESLIDESLYPDKLVVCHGDLNHNNFLYSKEEDYLYLVDWENVKIADPISDITLLLCQYLKPSEWMEWFDAYGIKYTDCFYKRVRWYSLMNCLFLVKQYFGESRNHIMNQYVMLLKSIYESDEDKDILL